MYTRRVQLAGGEAQTGLERWGKLLNEFEGGAEQVALAGLRRFHGLQRCPSGGVSTYTGHWQELRNRHGSLVPDQSQWDMLQHMRPTDVAKEVRDRTEKLKTTQAAIDYLEGELARYNDRHLSMVRDNVHYGPIDPVNPPTHGPSENRKIDALKSQIAALTAAFIGAKGFGKWGQKEGQGRSCPARKARFQPPGAGSHLSRNAGAVASNIREGDRRAENLDP